MKKEEKEQIITQYLKKIYSFMLKKTANLQDAEDLTQEVALRLYKALGDVEIENIPGFIWRIVHNVAANYYRGKAKNSMGICIDELTGVLTDESDIADKVMKDETMRQLQNEIAYLSKMQREIIVLYYYRGKKQEEIAQLLGIPKGTVKWHLFEAKAEIKKGMEMMREASELKFNPIKFELMGVSGLVGTRGGTANFFRSILAQNIAYCVRVEGRTINEIAQYLGVSPVYIESEVEFLEEYGFLIKQGKKYFANLLIDEPTSRLNQLHDEMYETAARMCANELFDELIQSDILQSKGLYYPQGDINFLMWTLVFYIATISGEKFRDDKISFEEVTTLRPDGGNNIAYASVENKDIEPIQYLENMKQWCGPCWNEIDDTILWQIDSEWSTRRVGQGYQDTIQRDLLLLRRYLGEDLLSLDEYTYLAQRGYIKIEDAAKISPKSTLQIVWIKDRSTKEKFLEIGDRIKEKYKEQFKILKAPYQKEMLEHMPKHLRKMRAYGLQYIFYSDGWFLLYCAKELVKSGKLRVPSEEQKMALTTLVIQNKN